MTKKKTNLKVKYFKVNGGVNWNECKLSKIINDIIDGQNKATDAINYVINSSKQADQLSKSMSDIDQWIHGTDNLGNEAYYCENGDNNSTISILDIPDEYKNTIKPDYTFAKYVIINQNIDGYSSNHGFIWYATEAAPIITSLIFAKFVLSKMVRIVRLTTLLIRANRIDELVPELENEMNAELEVIPEVEAELEVDVDAMVIFTEIGELMTITLAIIIIFIIVEYFVIQDYNSLVLYVNLSKKNFLFSSVYLDNIDLDHLPLPLNPSSKSNTLPAFQRINKYDPNYGFKPDEPYAHMLFLSFVNKHTVLQGLGTLLKFQEIDNSDKNFMSLYEVNRFKDNRQGIEINYPKTDYKDYYDDNSHKHNNLRIDTSSSDIRIISQTNELSSAEKNIYKTVVIIMDK